MGHSKEENNNQEAIDYLQSYPHEKRRKDGLKILELMRKITQLEPRMYGSTAIGFGNYRYTYKSGRTGEAPLVTFAPRKQNLVLYILNGYNGQEEHLQRLGKYKTGKVCLYINKLEDVDLEVLQEMILGSFTHTREHAVRTATQTDTGSDSS